MAKISREPAPGVSEQERKERLESTRYYTRDNKSAKMLTLVHKRRKKKK
jgi:hypothetical protein